MKLRQIVRQIIKEESQIALDDLKQMTAAYQKVCAKFEESSNYSPELDAELSRIDSNFEKVLKDLHQIEAKLSR